jgi:hypothetical protein
VSLVYVNTLMIRRVLTEPECMAVSLQWTTAACRAMFQAATAEFDNRFCLAWKLHVLRGR